MNVSSILQRKGTGVETATPNATIAEAAQRLTERGIGSLVILDDGGELVGVLSERDLVRALFTHGRSSWDLPISEILTGAPVTCTPEDSLRHVLSLMTVRRARHLPVLAGRDLVGIVSIGDIVKGQLEDLELEVGVLRDYARVRM